MVDRKPRKRAAKKPLKRSGKAQKRKAKKPQRKANPMPPDRSQRTEKGTDGLKQLDKAIRPEMGWESRGESPVKMLEKRFKDFVEEVEWCGRRIERNGSRIEKKATSWWYRTFGPLGPFLEGIIGVFCIWVGAIIINLVNLAISSSFLADIASFLNTHLAIFLPLGLLFNYLKYACMVVPSIKVVVKPIEAAAGITVALWLLGWAFRFAYQSSGIAYFSGLSIWLFEILWPAFTGLLVLGYLVAALVCSMSPVCRGRK